MLFNKYTYAILCIVFVCLGVYQLFFGERDQIFTFFGMTNVLGAVYWAYRSVNLHLSERN